MENNKLKIVFLGPPTSGKGTQSEIVADELDLTHISTGEIFRKHVLDKTELGIQIKDVVNSGHLVADSITNEIVSNRLVDVHNGFILDGYPRDIMQARALDEMLDITHAFFIEIPDDEVIRRVSGRRVCKVCGKLHNINSKKMKGRDTCIECNGELVLRSDDTEKVIKERLKEYHEKTEAMVNFYRKEKVLIEIDGSLPIEIISREILDGIKKDD